MSDKYQQYRLRAGNITLMEYNQEQKELIIYLDEKGLNFFLGDVEIQQDAYDHFDIGNLSQVPMNPANALVTWFQFQHVHTPEGWNHLLWFDAGIKGKVAICYLDNPGVDVFVSKLQLLMNPDTPEVTLTQGRELSPPDSPIRESAELVQSVRIRRLD